MLLSPLNISATLRSGKTNGRCHGGQPELSLSHQSFIWHLKEVAVFSSKRITHLLIEAHITSKQQQTFRLVGTSNDGTTKVTNIIRICRHILWLKHRASEHIPEIILSSQFCPLSSWWLINILRPTIMLACSWLTTSTFWANCKCCTTLRGGVGRKWDKALSTAASLGVVLHLILFYYITPQTERLHCQAPIANKRH